MNTRYTVTVVWNKRKDPTVYSNLTDFGFQGSWFVMNRHSRRIAIPAHQIQEIDGSAYDSEEN